MVINGDEQLVDKLLKGMSFLLLVALAAILGMFLGAYCEGRFSGGYGTDVVVLYDDDRVGELLSDLEGTHNGTNVKIVKRYKGVYRYLVDNKPKVIIGAEGKGFKVGVHLSSKDMDDRESSYRYSDNLRSYVFDNLELSGFKKVKDTPSDESSPINKEIRIYERKDANVTTLMVNVPYVVGQVDKKGVAKYTKKDVEDAMRIIIETAINER